MTNLFIAIEVPMVAGASLAHLQPPPTTGIRLVVPAQMHVTLHCVGATNLAVLVAALQSVIVASSSSCVDEKRRLRQGDTIMSNGSGKGHHAPKRSTMSSKP